MSYSELSSVCLAGPNTYEKHTRLALASHSHTAAAAAHQEGGKKRASERESQAEAEANTREHALELGFGVV